MYYPIIDKLKELMTDITSVKEKEPLVVEATLITQNVGTWEGNFSDIFSAFGNRPVYFKLIVLPTGDKYFVPLVHISNTEAFSCLINVFNATAYGILHSNNNTFELQTV